MAEDQESSKLKWMYEGTNSSIDREAYLLGKRIKDPTGDKGDFIVKDEKDKNYDLDVLERLDYESKMREDPLISMKKTEADKRWELLQNPVKRKKLQAAWEHALKRDLKKSKKKKKRSSSNDSSPSRSRKRSKKTSKSRDIVKAAESDDKIRNSLKMALENQLGDLSSDDSSDSSSDDNRKRKSKKSSKKKRTDYKNDKKSEKVERKEGYGLLVLKNKEEPECSSYKKVDLSKAKKNDKVALIRSKPTGFTKKLSAAELEKKRKEMMKNAEDQNKSRKSKIKKYALEDKADQIREEILRQSQLKKSGKYSKAKTFIDDLSLHHSSTGSLEDSLNRKRFTITKKTDQTM